MNEVPAAYLLIVRGTQVRYSPTRKQKTFLQKLTSENTPAYFGT
jgi:hypothetical protein